MLDFIFALYKSVEDYDVITSLSDIETFRTFAIIPAKNYVDVGRASKNENKSLIAAKDNV